MKDMAGFLLRENWKEKGKPDCEHPEFSKERSCSGVPTGSYICTTCGQLMQMKHLDNPRQASTISRHD